MNIPILKIPYTKKERNNIKNGIDKIIDSGFFTLGNKVKEFEYKFAKFVGTKYAIAVNSGTSALEIIFRSLKIEGKDIIMPGEVYDHMCHEQPVFLKYKNKIINFKENLNNSNTLKKVQLCLPLYRGLKKKNLDYIIKSINKTIETLEK